MWIIFNLLYIFKITENINPFSFLNQLYILVGLYWWCVHFWIYMLIKRQSLRSACEWICQFGLTVMTLPFSTLCCSTVLPSSCEEVKYNSVPGVLLVVYVIYEILCLCIHSFLCFIKQIKKCLEKKMIHFQFICFYNHKK